MHILYLNKVSPLEGGGAEARIREVGTRLSKMGHRVSVLCGATSIQNKQYEIVDGLHIYYVRSTPHIFYKLSKINFYYPRLSYFFFAPHQLKNLLRTIPPVNVIRDDISPFPMIQAVSIARLHNISIFATVHNLGGTWKCWCEYYGVILGSIGYQAERWIRKVQRYDGIVSDSKWMKESLATDLPQERLHWIPNGVDIDVFVPAKRTLDDRSPINLFYAGRFVKLKGHTLLLEAFSQVLKNHPELNLFLHLAGDGPLLTEMQQYAKSLNIIHRTYFHGKKGKDEMPNLYRQMDIYVSPSYFEGLPVTFIEAMASGLPIISTQIEAINGVLNEHNSYIVPSQSIGELAEAIYKMTTNLVRLSQMRDNARLHVEQGFSWSKITADEQSLMFG